MSSSEGPARVTAPTTEITVVTGDRYRVERDLKDLERIREQLESGSLVIRQMTEEERRRYPPVAAPAKRSGRR